MVLSAERLDVVEFLAAEVGVGLVMKLDPVPSAYGASESSTASAVGLAEPGPVV